MPDFKDLSGETFGYLKVLYRFKDDFGRNTMAHCVCRCGKEIDVKVHYLYSKCPSCGCAKDRFNKYSVVDNVAFCELSNGIVFKFDASDLDIVKQHKWHFDGRYIKSNDTRVRLHRFILGCDCEDIDHINHDELDNRRCNLRNCSHKENLRNMQMHKDNASGYKGVSYDKGMKKYCAQIYVDGKSCIIGYYDNPKDAAEKYYEYAKKVFGEFATSNILEKEVK